MKVLLISSILLTACYGSFAQCGKHFVLTSSKTQHVAANGDEAATENETAVIDINKNTISVTINNDPPSAGVIKSDSCLWKVPYRDGKSFIKAELKDQQGKVHPTNITIEGTNGYVTLLFQVVDVPDDLIRVIADKFEEKD